MLLCLILQELEATVSQLQTENASLRNELSVSVEHLQSEKNALESSLVELDEEHQKEINKIISVKNELVKSNAELTSKYDSLHNSYCKYEQENAILVGELQNLRKELLGKEAEGESFLISSSTDILHVTHRQEPEGAPINSEEPAQASIERDAITGNENYQLVVQEKDSIIQRFESKFRQFEVENEDLKLQLEAKQRNVDKLENELKIVRAELCNEKKSRAEIESLRSEEKNLDASKKSSVVHSVSSEKQFSVSKEDECMGSQRDSDSLQAEYVETTGSSAKVGNENKIVHLLNENEKLSAELERLRKHLVEIEENYTQELLVAAHRESEVTAQLNAAEELIDSLKKQLINDEKLEKLREQLKKVSSERDKALEEVSQLDDKLHKSTASISNLQLVIEQIQKGLCVCSFSRVHYVFAENEWRMVQIEKQHDEVMVNQKAKTEELKRKLRWYEEKHLESKNALDAASRLAEQIDVKEATIKNLKSEIANNRTLIDKLCTEISELKNSYEGKVDKQIIKSLVLGYFNTPHDKKHEVQRLLARILDFNHEEMQKAGLQIGVERSKFGSGNWTSLTQSDSQQQSLAKAFVQFLETESKPTNPSIQVHELAKGFTDVVSTNKN
ncbi:Thyroid receptor-interacting protein 11-like protein, partial [Leptotrombidium deliense]